MRSATVRNGDPLGEEVPRLPSTRKMPRRRPLVLSDAERGDAPEGGVLASRGSLYAARNSRVVTQIGDGTAIARRSLTD